MSRTPGPGGADLTSSMETTYSENSSSSTASSSADQPIYFRWGLRLGVSGLSEMRLALGWSMAAAEYN